MHLHGRVICLASMLVKTPHMDPVGMSSFVKEYAKGEMMKPVGK